MISLQLFLIGYEPIRVFGFVFLPYLVFDQTSPIVPDNVQMQFGKMCAAVFIFGEKKNKKTLCPGTPSQ